jgi:FkbM family methyltransferase
MTNRKDISLLDESLSYINYLKDILTSTLRYRNTYRNYLTVSFQLVLGQFPIHAVLKNGEKITICDQTGIMALSNAKNHERITYDIEEDAWIIVLPAQHHLNREESGSQGKVIRIYGGRENGEVPSIFLDDAYAFLPVKGKTVIDVGANICDSSIYFALCGAKKIIAVEPLPKNFEIGKKNIEVNNLVKEITLLVGGCNGKQGSTVVDRRHQGIGAYVMGKNNDDNNNSIIDSNTIRIPLLTLEDILDNSKDLSNDIILKIDCEGCEYDVILSADRNMLRRFSHILIEYHYGYRSIVRKLKNAGFEISKTRPIARPRRDYLYGPLDEKWFYSGYIYAKRTSVK